jgi:hypothetical protein
MTDNQSSILVRLDETIYKELESKCPIPFVQGNTTELQAGFQLGVQHVLKMLREGYTVKTRR